MSKCYRKVFLKIGVVSLILIALLIPPEYLLLVNAQDMIDSPVTIDFKDTDIRDVLRTLSRQTGKSIVADPDVSGSVTIHLSDVV